MPYVFKPLSYSKVPKGWNEMGKWNETEHLTNKPMFITLYNIDNTNNDPQRFDRFWGEIVFLQINILKFKYLIL